MKEETVLTEKMPFPLQIFGYNGIIGKNKLGLFPLWGYFRLRMAEKAFRQTEKKGSLCRKAAPYLVKVKTTGEDPAYEIIRCKKRNTQRHL